MLEGSIESQLGGTLQYTCAVVTDARVVHDTIRPIAAQHCQRGPRGKREATLTLDAIKHSEADVEKISRCNFWGTFLCATAVGRHMLEQKTRGSILLVVSMSGMIANRAAFPLSIMVPRQV